MAVTAAVVWGPAVRGPAVKGPVVGESAVKDRAVKETAVKEPAVKGPAVEGPAVRGPAVGRVPVEPRQLRPVRRIGSATTRSRAAGEESREPSAVDHLPVTDFATGGAQPAAAAPTLASRGVRRISSS